MTRAHVMASVLCGVLWGGMVSFLLLDGHLRSSLGYGFVVSPIIGIVAGSIAVLFRDADVIELAIVSLVSLYLAAALFGLGAGIVIALAAGGPFAAALTLAFTVPWAMTFGGFVLWMWPLAYFNHKFVARLA